jgi:hypothetical protein
MSISLPHFRSIDSLDPFVEYTQHYSATVVYITVVALTPGYFKQISQSQLLTAAPMCPLQYAAPAKKIKRNQINYKAQLSNKTAVRSTTEISI